MSSLVKKIRIMKVEQRMKDSWVDMSLRSLREGEVRFYRVNDPLTGKWLFKVCTDKEKERTIVKALTCPPGRGFAQLEGSTMLFQKSLQVGHYYGVVSLSYIDETERLRRNVVENVEEVPIVLKEHFKITSYEEATGKKAMGKRLAVLCGESDEKSLITIFLLQRAWSISSISPYLGAKSFDILDLIKDLEKATVKDIYQATLEKYQLTKEDTDELLKLLEANGKIIKSDEYVKTKV